GRSTVYIRKRNPQLDTDKPDQYNRYIAISTRCMHLGCPVRYTPAAQRFICPCHGGVYDFQGKVSGGPPVRPLDRFYTRINGNGQAGPLHTGAEVGKTVVDWVDERTSLSGAARWMMFRKVPKGTNWFYTLGSATMFAFLSQAVTGVFLAMYYDPSPTRAYESARYITNEAFPGEFVRCMHKW